MPVPTVTPIAVPPMPTPLPEPRYVMFEALVWAGMVLVDLLLAALFVEHVARGAYWVHLFMQGWRDKGGKH